MNVRFVRPAELSLRHCGVLPLMTTRGEVSVTHAEHLQRREMAVSAADALVPELREHPSRCVEVPATPTSLRGYVAVPVNDFAALIDAAQDS